MEQRNVDKRMENNVAGLFYARNDDECERNYIVKTLQK